MDEDALDDSKAESRPLVSDADGQANEPQQSTISAITGPAMSWRGLACRPRPQRQSPHPAWRRRRRQSYEPLRSI